MLAQEPVDEPEKAGPAWPGLRLAASAVVDLEASSEEQSEPGRDDESPPPRAVNPVKLPDPSLGSVGTHAESAQVISAAAVPGDNQDTDTAMVDQRRPLEQPTQQVSSAATLPENEEVNPAKSVQVSSAAKSKLPADNYQDMTTAPPTESAQVISEAGGNHQDPSLAKVPEQVNPAELVRVEQLPESVPLSSAAKLAGDNHDKAVMNQPAKAPEPEQVNPAELVRVERLPESVLLSSAPGDNHDKAMVNQPAKHPEQAVNPAELVRVEQLPKSAESVPMSSAAKLADNPEQVNHPAELVTPAKLAGDSRDNDKAMVDQPAKVPEQVNPAKLPQEEQPTQPLEPLEASSAAKLPKKKKPTASDLQSNQKAPGLVMAVEVCDSCHRVNVNVYVID